MEVVLLLGEVGSGIEWQTGSEIHTDKWGKKNGK